MPLALLLGRAALSTTAAAEARLLLGLTIDAITEGEEPGQEPSEEIVPVSSSAIRTITWRDDQTITVEFNARGTYTYAGDRALFDAFVSAPSKGTFFNQNFK